jgi:DNA integrity scanning protein DisA with diadenylate cyclase activity
VHPVGQRNSSPLTITNYTDDVMIVQLLIWIRKLLESKIGVLFVTKGITNSEQQAHSGAAHKSYAKLDA